MKESEYAAEYQHGGSTWALNFFARDSEDAEAKMNSIRASAVLLGEIVGTVDCDSTAPDEGRIDRTQR